MLTGDCLVLAAYVPATTGTGMLLGRKVKNSAGRFAADCASPW